MTGRWRVEVAVGVEQEEQQVAVARPAPQALLSARAGRRGCATTAGGPEGPRGEHHAIGEHLAVGLLDESSRCQDGRAGAR
jgi:hypothetical protein